MAKNWIASAISKPGALHKQMGIPDGKKIPAGKLERAADKGGKLGERARLAETLEGMHKTGRHGGVLGKVAAGKMGHDKQATTPVESDRGAFRIRG